MLTVQEKDFVSDIEKYFDMAKINPLTIERRSGERYTITFDFLNDEEEFAGRPATEEELQLYNMAMKNRATGNYYAQKDGETIEEFLERIDADPVNQLVCNITK